MLAGLRKRTTERKLSKMRSAKNLHPEWGHVPARTIDFMRVISIFLVATTVGATAGGGVVLSLVDVPPSQASVAAHTLAASVKFSRVRGATMYDVAFALIVCGAVATAIGVWVLLLMPPRPR